MTDSHDPGPTRNKFEAFLREHYPSGYTLYVQVKKEAISNGTDPYLEFREFLAKGAPDKSGTPALDMKTAKEKAVAFWFKAIGLRLVVPEPGDVDFLRNAMSEQQMDLERIVILLGGDRKKAADVICALHLRKLEGMDYSSIYMVVEKLIHTKKQKKAAEPSEEQPVEEDVVRPTPPTPKRFFFDEIPESVIAGNVDAFEILKKYGIEDYQREYQIDPILAERELESRVAECQEPNKKLHLESIRDYYRELQDMEIPGIVSTAKDARTGEDTAFPAVHQKIGARFIATKKRVLIADKMGLGKTAQAIIAKNLIDKQEEKKTTSVVVVPNNVLDQWEGQISLWNTEKKSIVMITSEKKEESVKKAIDERPDFVLVSYDMVIQKSGESKVGERLAPITDYLVLDEVHNAKDADSFSSLQAMELSRAAKYVCMLSGTPVPNRVSDLGVVASILWNHEFEPEEFNRRYKKNPRVVRERILPFMLRRHMKETFGESSCQRHVVEVPMTDAQEMEHERIALNRERKNALALIAQLRRCALDPRLVGIDEDSAKYKKLLEMLVDHQDGRPAVVFSSELKEGVLDKLCAELSGYGFKVARIDGDPKRSGKRRKVILEDVTQGKYDIVLATLATLGEGVNQLTVASRAYLIDIPFTDARLEQGITRLDRMGQKNPVDIYLMVSENSIDSLLLRLIEQKKILGEFLIDGMELTDQEKQIIDEAEKLVESGKDVLRSLYRFFGSTTNRRSEEVCRLLRDEAIGAFIAEHYWENFEGSYYGNTMNLIVNVIQGLEKGGKKFERALDIASGPCCLARAWGRPVASLDANRAALAYGKVKLGEKAGDAIHASFTAMPIQDSRFDLAVFSLGILHSAPDERERILRETNRVLDVGGVAIITTPSGEGRYEKLAKALPMLGFKVLPQITGTAMGVDKNDFECMIISAVKVGAPQEEALPVGLFDFHKDSMESESWEANVSRKIKRKVCTEFEIDDKTAVDAGKQSACDMTGATFTPEPVKNPIRFLKEKYGNVRKAVEKAPADELASLGVEKFQKPNSRCFGLRLVDDDMRERHDEFVKKVKGPRGTGWSEEGDCMKLAPQSLRPEKSKVTKPARAEPMAEGIRKERKPRGFYVRMKDDELIVFAKAFIKEKEISGKKDLKKADGGLYDAIRRRNLQDKVGLEEKNRDLTAKDDKKLVEHAKAFIAERGISGRKEMEKADRGLYEDLRRRGLLDECGIESSTARNRDWAAMDDMTLVEHAKVFIAERGIHWRSELNDVDRGLYQALRKRKILGKIGLEKKRRDFARMDDSALVGYGKAIIAEREIGGRKKLEKADGGLYNILKKRDLLERVGLGTSKADDRDWAAMDGLALISDAKKFIMESGIEGRMGMRIADMGRYQALRRRKLLDLVFSDIESSKHKQAVHEVLAAMDKFGDSK